MSHVVEARRRASWSAAAVTLALVFPAALCADLLVLRDGSEVRGRLVQVDAHRVLFAREEGGEVSFSRARVARIEFGEAPASLRARVHVLEGDDEVRLFLDGAELAAPATLEKGWFDLAPLLKDGPHQLTAEVTNRTAFWAYRWVLEAGTETFDFACGLARKSGCTAGGRDPREKGTMPAGKAWLFVHRESGEIRVETETP